MNELTKEQQTAMKPWAITAIVASVVRLIALGLFCLYLSRPRQPSLHTVTIWIAAILFIPHFVVVICSRRVSRVTGEYYSLGLWILTLIAVIIFAALTCFTW